MKNGPYEFVVAPKRYPGKRYRGRYAYEHHVVYWQHFKKMPPTGHIIHHINGDHRDNRIENLKAMTKEQHSSLHAEAARKKAERAEDCWYCFKPVTLPASRMRLRKKRNKSNAIFCDARCGAMHQHYGPMQPEV